MLSFKPVTHTFIRKAPKTFRITYENGTLVETTGDHPFSIKDRDWTEAKDLSVFDRSNTEKSLAIKESSARTPVLAGNLPLRIASYGSKSAMSDGTLGIVSIEVIERPETVYNFTVQDDHTYFVTDAEVWVHNAGGRYAVTPYDSRISPETVKADINSFVNSNKISGQNEAYLKGEHGTQIFGLYKAGELTESDLVYILNNRDLEDPASTLEDVWGMIEGFRQMDLLEKHGSSGNFVTMGEGKYSTGFTVEASLSNKFLSFFSSKSVLELEMTERKDRLSRIDGAFNYVNGDFFSPSHGFSSDESKIYMNQYALTDFGKDVMIRIDNQFENDRESGYRDDTGAFTELGDIYQMKAALSEEGRIPLFEFTNDPDPDVNNGRTQGHINHLALNPEMLAVLPNSYETTSPLAIINHEMQAHTRFGDTANGFFTGGDLSSNNYNQSLYNRIQARLNHFAGTSGGAMNEIQAVDKYENPIRKLLGYGPRSHYYNQSDKSGACIVGTAGCVKE